MIRANGIGKQFDGQWIFRNLTLIVEAGKAVSIIGSSGSGKSVLLKLIAGLLSPDEESIETKSSNIGMLFQKNALFDSLTVEENLYFPLKERKHITGDDAKHRVSKLLDDVGLTGCEKQFPDEISGGMQKRLGIARALIVEPEIILYDEPTAGLDPITSRKIAELVKSLRFNTGSTLIIITNDIQRAYQLSDTIYLLNGGELINGGSPDEIKQTDDPRIRQFIFGLKDGPLTSGLN